MALINTLIASLFNGVSQQPAPLRLSSQCEASDNFYPTIATGLNKRPPTKHLAKLTTDTDTNAYVTVISRDTSERYVLFLRDGSISVFDALTGEAKAVTYPDGLGYLDCENPNKDFSAVTVADHTFIINRTKKVEYLPDATDAAPNVAYVVFTYNGAGVGRSLTVTVNSTTTQLGTASWSGGSNDTGPSISAIQSGLSASLGSSFSVTNPFANIIKITKLDASTDWEVVAADTYGSSLTKVIQGSVQTFADLPVAIDDGYVVYVTTRPYEQGKGYYVRYSAKTNSYIECPAPGTVTSLDPSTMPHKLVRNPDGSFTLMECEWAPRKVGDYASNPWPSFVGRTITYTFFYRNRLGFLADESVILSTAGDYYNFFAKTATAVTDADPIDEAVANTKVSLLRWAIPFNKVLLLFSDQTQFQLSAGDILSPKTVKADAVTEFVSSSRCRPVGAGNQLFFVSEKPTSSGVREYFVAEDTMTNDAADITAHVPRYIPKDAYKLSVSTSEDVLCLLSEAERNTMYVYKYYWGAQEKVQSAWFKFTFQENESLLGMEFVGSVAYVVIRRADGIYLESMNFQSNDKDTGLPFEVLLDRKVYLSGTYDPATVRTSWTLPWNASGSVWAVLGEGFGTQRGAALQLSHNEGSTVSVPGDWSAAPAFIGVRYTARFRFSEQYIKDANNGVIASAIIKIRRMLISYATSGYFRVEVTPPGRDTFTYPFAGRVLGVSGLTLGEPALSDGSFRVPIMSSARGVIIELVNDSPLPSNFQSAEWEGEMVLQAKR
jgi:hypothetical protein